MDCQSQLRPTGVATELGWDFGGAALQEVSAVPGLLIPGTIRTLMSHLAQKEIVTTSGTVNNRAIL